ncbi:MAG: hypothetical protein IT432_08750 [Phycisphaerales bacterium]|nr:hypothetical protein [Phycisphaerales bacterium]
MNVMIKMGVVGAAVAMASAASAAIYIGQPLYVPAGHEAVVTFHSSDAGWTGDVYWMGGDSERDGLGQWLFNNHASTPSDSVSLGVFNAETPLYFAYDITAGGLNTYRMTDSNEINQFAYEDIGVDHFRMRIEDIKLPDGDKDYNDCMFDVRFYKTPAPGAATLGGLGLLLGFRRRRAS